MNNYRRKQLNNLIDALDDWHSQFEYGCMHTKLDTVAMTVEFSNLLDNAQSVLDDEQESFDNMPDGIRWGGRGNTSEEAISSMEAAVSDLESVMDCLEELDDSEPDNQQLMTISAGISSAMDYLDMATM